MGLWSVVYKDYRRHRSMGAGRFTTLFLTQGLGATTVYRISRYLLLKAPEGSFRRILRVFLAVAQKGVEVVAGISLPPECEIGEGFYVGHYGNIIIGKGCRLGRNCNVSQGVTIGVGGRRNKRGCAVVGDRVYIGPNAILFGDIAVGDDSAVGAGAIVNRSFPELSNILGNPARRISSEGSFDFIMYDGMLTDPDRRAALARRSETEPASSSAGCPRSG